ncbi:MAG: flagellar assembly protein FliX [Pseudomonadota bacterium]
MKVERAQTTSSGVRRTARRAGGAAFSLGETADTQGTGEAAGAKSAQAVGSIDALMALQGVPEGASGRKRAVGRAASMLDLLDEIRISLLSGRLPQNRLQQLVKVVESQRERLHDPRLETVLDEIELRARVELAKYDRYL